MQDNFFVTEPEVESHAHERESSAERNRIAVQMLKKTRDILTHVIQLLEDGDSARATRQLVDLVTHHVSARQELEQRTGSRIVEGMFDGVCMTGSDGHRYPVPENYASKSRLIEGDMLKLTIQPDGRQVFKQIGPVVRERKVGCLRLDPDTREHVVVCSDQVYKILSASVSYFRAAPGDELVILVPREGTSQWAAVEGIGHA